MSSPLADSKPLPDAGPAPAWKEPIVSSRAGVILALVSVYLVWGSTYLAMRIGLTGFAPFLMAGTRFTIAGTLLMAVLLVRGASLPTAKEWGGAAIVGILLLTGGNGGVVYAEQTVGSGLAALALATVPLLTALLTGLWGQWPTGREWVGLAVGFAGIVLLNMGGGLRASPAGAIALLAAASAWALGSVWSRRLPQPPGMMASAAGMLCGGAALLALGAAQQEHWRAHPSPASCVALAYLVFAAIAGFSAYVYLLARVRPALATSYAYVNPIIAVALGAAFAGEKLTPVVLVSGLLIVAGVILVMGSKSKRQTA